MNIFVDSADYSVGMALLDMVPVILFFVAGVFLLKDMYNKLVKGNYALLATGTIMIFFAGLFKAIYKSLVALNVCAWEALNLAFFPMQATGFLLLGAAMVGVFYSQKENKGNEPKTMAILPFSLLPLVFAEVAPFTSSMPFVVIQVIGATVFYAILFVIALKMKIIPSYILIAVAFVTMIGMGYLSTRASAGSENVTLWNWIAEADNTVSQGALLAAVILMHRKGLASEDAYSFKKQPKGE